MVIILPEYTIVSILVINWHQ